MYLSYMHEYCSSQQCAVTTLPLWSAWLRTLPVWEIPGQLEPMPRSHTLCEAANIFITRVLLVVDGSY